jgi:hypothetical protein
MTPADHARNNAISLEAKKDALSQRQSGDWRVSFTVQGIDMDTRLTQAPMGTRYVMVLVEIGENEEPAQQEVPAASRQDSPPISHPDGAARQKMDWRELQPAAQAGIRCADPVFIAYLKEQQPNAWRAHQDAASLVRWICGVKSRSELGTNHLARVMWKTLDDQFQAWKALEHA